jgi:hypothetical protein
MKSNYGRSHGRQVLLSLLLIACSACILSIGSSAVVSGNIHRQSPAQSSTPSGTPRDEVWGHIDPSSLSSRAEQASPRAYEVLELNAQALSAALNNAPMEFTEAAKGNRAALSLPMPDGTLSRFRIEESPVMEPALAAQFPEVKSYRGQGLDDPTATARFDWSPLGFHALIISANGSAYVEPYTANDTQHYVTYYKESLQDGFEPPRCEINAELQDSIARQLSTAELAALSIGTSLRTYRLALATTVEYTNNSTYGGGKPATLTKLNTIVNLINAIYEREVSIRLQLVSGELSIIFDAEPDGYTNTDVGTMLNENPTVLNSQIGLGAYDIGHVFGLSSAGSSSGVAQIGVVCGANKGRGASVLGIALVTGNFSIDSGLVAHEFGHEFSAFHTFNSTSNFCGSAGQRNASTAFEPGSGSTLMAYPGICSPENLQQNSDNYFFAGSFDQIAGYVTGSGAGCAALTPTGNNPPTVSAGPDYAIPMGTPFTLTASGSDPDGDPLTYSWEEMDTGNPSPAMTDDGTRPLFRSFNAVTSPSRTFPKLSDILNNTATIGELLPTTTRAMNFRVTARDNRATGGGVSSDQMVLTVTSNAGPFVVTSPNTGVAWSGGSTQSVTWNVAGTSSAPVNCSSVKISLSTDGGSSFPVVLVTSTPNDGSQSITVPNVATTSARIKVEAVGNVFFDVSNANFTITQSSSGGGSGTAGLYNPAGGSFFLRNSNTGGVADTSFTYGPAGLGFIPLVGDWNGDGVDTVGLYDPSHAAFFLRNSNTGGIADISFTFGPAGLGFIPIVGDWNGDGVDTIGLYDPAHAAFFLRNSNTGGVADISFTFGPAGLGFIPIVGDWNGDRIDTIGLYDPSHAAFFLRNSNSGGIADISFTYGPAGLGFIPLVGDWNGDGVDTIGLYNPAGAAFFLRNSNTGGIADITFTYGPAALGFKPLVGDWDGL